MISTSTQLILIVTIQFVKFTYCNDQFPCGKIINKKNASLIEDIKNQGWIIASLIII
jgi:hypothetical protein